MVALGALSACRHTGNPEIYLQVSDGLEPKSGEATVIRETEDPNASAFLVSLAWQGLRPEEANEVSASLDVTLREIEGGKIVKENPLRFRRFRNEGEDLELALVGVQQGPLGPGEYMVVATVKKPEYLQTSAGDTTFEATDSFVVKGVPLERSLPYQIKEGIEGAKEPAKQGLDWLKQKG